MRTVFTIILTFSLLSLKAQTTKTISVSTDKQNHFNNQGEQEDYWTQQFFKDNYVKQSFDKYNGNIYASGDSIKYLDQIFIVFNSKANLKDIFLKGLFYPAIITGQTKADTIKISNFEELSFTNKNATQKRYRFWLYQKRLLNPTVCFIELTNPNATDKTDSKTFLEGASLTFYKTGWIII